MKEMTIFAKSIKDYFSGDMLKILLIPLLGSAFVLYISFFTIASSGLDSHSNINMQIEQQESHMENGILVTNSTKENYVGSSIVEFLLNYTITSWLVGFFVYTIGIFAIGYLSIFISIIIVGFLTPKILAIIHHKHYATLEIEEGYGTVFGSLYKLIKTFFIMIILFIVLIPLYFIPLVNIFAINIPFLYLFHKMLQYDIGSTILSKSKYEELYYHNRSELRAKSIFLYTISLIPFFAFFLSVFYIIYLGHSYFKIIENKKLESKDI